MSIRHYIKTAKHDTDHTDATDYTDSYFIAAAQVVRCFSECSRPNVESSVKIRALRVVFCFWAFRLTLLSRKP